MTSTCDKDDQSKFDRFEQRITGELKTIKKEVDDLYNTVYKGNGHPSLVTRMNSVEGKLRGLRETMDEKISHLTKENALKFDSIHQKLESKFGRLEGWIETKFSSIEHTLRMIHDNRTIDRAGNWQQRAAVIAAFAAIVGACIAFFGGFFR